MQWKIIVDSERGALAPRETGSRRNRGPYSAPRRADALCSPAVCTLAIVFCGLFSGIVNAQPPAPGVSAVGLDDDLVIDLDAEPAVPPAAPPEPTDDDEWIDLGAPGPEQEGGSR